LAEQPGPNTRVELPFQAGHADLRAGNTPGQVCRLESRHGKLKACATEGGQRGIAFRAVYGVNRRLSAAEIGFFACGLPSTVVEFSTIWRNL
jgi:hypothetical protein